MTFDSRLSLKIAIWHNLPSGGAKRALYDQVKGLVARGHRVQSWRLSTADPDYLPLQEVVEEHVVPFDWHSQSSARRLGHFVGKWLDVPSGPVAMEDACRRCAEEINAGGFDVLLAHACWFYHAPTIGPALASVAPHLPRVLYLQEPMRRLHEAFPNWIWAAPDPVPWGPDKPRAFLARMRNALNVRRDRLIGRTELTNARAFDAILVNSYFSRESVARAYNLDARVCYLGVDTDLFQPPVNGEGGAGRGDFILSLGEIAERKRPDLVVRAVAALPEPRPPLWCVGNRAEEHCLNRMKELAEAGNVALTVRVGVPDEELIRLLQRARLVVYTPRLEPFGYAPLEANACGAPVVGVAEGGLRETIRDGVNGFLCEPEAKALAAGIRRLLDDPALAARISEQAPSYVRREWSVEQANVRLEAELCRVVRGQAAPAS